MKNIAPVDLSICSGWLLIKSLNGSASIVFGLKVLFFVFAKVFFVVDLAYTAALWFGWRRPAAAR